MRTKGRLEGS